MATNDATATNTPADPAAALRGELTAVRSHALTLKNWCAAVAAANPHTAILLGSAVAALADDVLPDIDAAIAAPWPPAD
jgi:hypothetical protein